jgi:hypothetical protein
MKEIFLIGALLAQTVHTPLSPPKFSLGKPVQEGCIALVPVISEKPISREKYITLSEAIRQKLVEIIEVPGMEQVNSLEVRNRAELPLLLFAGELLLGGKQDRIVGKDTIVPPRSSLQVPVFCVEHGRWRGEKLSFGDSGMLVNDEVRQAAAQSKNQQEVWNKVAETNAKAGKTADTGTIQATLSDPEVQKRISAVASKLFAGVVGDDNVIGVICTLNGSVHSADLFSSHDLFAASGLKVIKSYAADAELLSVKKNLPPDLKACEAFLQKIVSAQRVARDGVYYLSGGVRGFEAGSGGFGGGFGGGGFGHGNYKPGSGGG